MIDTKEYRKILKLSIKTVEDEYMFKANYLDLIKELEHLQKLKSISRSKYPIFDMGKRAGRKEIIEKFITLLDLDGRYQGIEEDY